MGEQLQKDYFNGLFLFGRIYSDNMGDETVSSISREAYLETARKQAMIVHADDFVRLSERFLSQVPLAGAAAFGLKDGREGILINWDHYEKGLGQNFTDCIDFEIEHEAQELWLTRGKSKVESKGPDHYEAAREAMRMAYRQGKLDRYLELKRAQMKTFDALGDAEAMEELAFYREFAESLKTS